MKVMINRTEYFPSNKIYEQYEALKEFKDNYSDDEDCIIIDITKGDMYELIDKIIEFEKVVVIKMTTENNYYKWLREKEGIEYMIEIYDDYRE